MVRGSRIVTVGLFIEFARKDSTQQAIYSVKHEDYLDPETGLVFPSLHRLYIDFGDPTEFNFSNHYFLNYSHWKETSEHPLVLPYAEKWRLELAQKVKADALQSIISVSRSGSKDAVTAARYIISGEWERYLNPDVKSNRGRPSNRKTSNIPLVDDKSLMEDFTRSLNVKSLS